MVRPHRPSFEDHGDGKMLKYIIAMFASLALFTAYAADEDCVDDPATEANECMVADDGAAAADDDADAPADAEADDEDVDDAADSSDDDKAS